MGKCVVDVETAVVSRFTSYVGWSCSSYAARLAFIHTRITVWRSRATKAAQVLPLDACVKRVELLAVLTVLTLPFNLSQHPHRLG